MLCVKLRVLTRESYPDMCRHYGIASRKVYKAFNETINALEVELESIIFTQIYDECIRSARMFQVCCRSSFNGVIDAVKGLYVKVVQPLYMK